MTKLKQQLQQKYTAKQEELTLQLGEFLERVVESAAEMGIEMSTISVSEDEIVAEGISLPSFRKFLSENSIEFRNTGEYVLIDLGE